MATYSFGVDESISADYLVQNFSENTQADQAEARDNNGNVAAFKFYNNRKEVSYEAIVPTGSTPPSVGSNITLGGVKYVVTSAQKSQSNTDYTRWSVTAMRYVDNALPANS